MAKVKAPKPTKYNKGDRIHAPGRIGEITCVIRGRKTKYEVMWSGKRLSTYTEYELEVIAYKIEKLEPDSKAVEAEAVQADLLNFPREQNWKVGDRILLKNTSLTGKIVDLAKGTIAWEDGTTSSNNTLSSTYFKCLPSKTIAQVSAPDIHLQQLSLENLISKDSAKSTNTAVISSPSDTQASQSKEISKPWTAHEKQSKSSQVRHPANHSQCKVKGSEPATKEIVSRHSSKKLQQLALDFSQSKMSEVSSLAHGDQATEAGHTSTIFAVTFAAWDSDLSVESSPVVTLEAPSLENDYCWLASPGALSSENSRAPGQSKLEANLKAEGILQPGECINPAYLEDAFTIPLGWSDRLVSQSATALLEEREKRSVTVSTPELPKLPLNESSTSIHSWKLGDRVELVELMEFNRRQLGETGTVTEIRSDGGIRRFLVTWDKRRPKVNNTTMFLEETKSVKLTDALDQSPAAHRSSPESSSSLINPVGKVFYHDALEVVGTCISTVQNWRETPRSPICQAVRLEPWWHKLKDRILPASFLVTLSELTEVTKFCSDIPEAPTDDSLEKSPSKQTGSIYQYTANKADKLGTIHTYPKVEGDRKREEDNHWYWGFSYVEKEQGKWRDKSASIPRKKLSVVRQALRDGKSYTYILQEILEK